MRSGSLLTRWPAPFARGIGRWLDQADQGRAVLVALVLFTAAWTLFHSIAYAPIGIHPDLSEVFAWSRHPALGYFKHPPLTGLMPAFWFAVFPISDWAYHLMALSNAALGLYFTDRIARLYLSGDKRLMVVLLLMLLPFYQFHGQRFNANQILLSLWPMTTYCFLRAFETRTFAWSAAAGIAAALAMLGKYYSIYLVAGIIVAALAHPARGAYLKSASPYVSVLTGLLALSPHLYWLVTTGYQPFAYAYAVHGATTTMNVFGHALSYLAGCAGYIALPMAVFVLMTRPDRRAWADIMWPESPGRRMLVILFAGFILLPPLSAPFLRLDLNSLWSMQAWFLLPIVLLASPLVRLERATAVRLASCVLLFTLMAIVIGAPLRAWQNFRNGNSDNRGYTRELSMELTREWRNNVGRPLAVVMGDAGLTASISFYSPDHPDSVMDFNLQITPWLLPEQVKQLGWVAVCKAEDKDCVGTAARLTAQEPRARRFTLTIVPKFLGYDGAPGRFAIIVVPPVGFAGHGARPPA